MRASDFAGGVLRFETPSVTKPCLKFWSFAQRSVNKIIPTTS